MTLLEVLFGMLFVVLCLLAYAIYERFRDSFGERYWWHTCGNREAGDGIIKDHRKWDKIYPVVNPECVCLCDSFPTFDVCNRHNTCSSDRWKEFCGDDYHVVTHHLKNLKL